MHFYDAGIQTRKVKYNDVKMYAWYRVQRLHHLDIFFLL